MMHGLVMTCLATLLLQANCMCVNGSDVLGSCEFLPCDADTKAKCTADLLCKCEPPACNVNGECVLPGECPRRTGHDCLWSDCPEGQLCLSASLTDHHCVCPEGQCFKNDTCVEVSKCVSKTNVVGSCKFFHCDTYKNATCGASPEGQLGTCVCEPPACNINTECLLPGQCPRYTGQDCLLSSCPAGQVCLSGKAWSPTDYHCVCPEGECFQNGTCVPQMDYLWQLGPWGAATELMEMPSQNGALGASPAEKMVVGELVGQMSGGQAAVAAVAVAVVVAAALLCIGSRKHPTPDGDFVALEDEGVSSSRVEDESHQSLGAESSLA